MTKLTSMKRMYKKIKDHNSKSGNDRQTWQYYEVTIFIIFCHSIKLLSVTYFTYSYIFKLPYSKLKQYLGRNHG